MENKVKKLLLILICLFVSFEVKSKEIVFKCDVKKKVFRINNIEGESVKKVNCIQPKNSIHYSKTLNHC